MWTCGHGLQGQTGLEQRGNITEPTQVPGVERITLVAAGPNHSVAVAADGRLWSWGDEDACPRANDERPPFCAHETQYIPRALELAIFGESAVLSVTAGQMHSAAVTAARELWTWGHGFLGPLGLGRMPFTQSAFRAPKRVGAPDAPGKRCVSTLVGVLCLCARRREGENET